MPCYGTAIVPLGHRADPARHRILKDRFLFHRCPGCQALGERPVGCRFTQDILVHQHRASPGHQYQPKRRGSHHPIHRHPPVFHYPGQLHGRIRRHFALHGAPRRAWPAVLPRPAITGTGSSGAQTDHNLNANGGADSCSAVLCSNLPRQSRRRIRGWRLPRKAQPPDFENK